MKNILNEIPENYDTLHGRTKHCCNIINSLELSNKTLVDLGCGFAWFERFLIENTNLKNIIGIEKSEQLINYAINFFDSTRIKFLNADVTSLPLSDEVCDICVSWDVIEHIEKNEEINFFKEAFRILKPGGHLYLSTPAKNFLSIMLDPAYFLTSHRHYTSKEIIIIAESVGFKMKSNEIRGGIFDLIYMNYLYIAKWIFRRKPFFLDWFHMKIDNEYSNSNGGIATLYCIFYKPLI